MQLAQTCTQRYVLVTVDCATLTVPHTALSRLHVLNSSPHNMATDLRLFAKWERAPVCKCDCCLKVVVKGQSLQCRYPLTHSCCSSTFTVDLTLRSLNGKEQRDTRYVTKQNKKALLWNRLLPGLLASRSINHSVIQSVNQSSNKLFNQSVH